MSPRAEFQFHNLIVGMMQAGVHSLRLNVNSMLAFQLTCVCCGAVPACFRFCMSRRVASVSAALSTGINSSIQNLEGAYGLNPKPGTIFDHGYTAIDTVRLCVPVMSDRTTTWGTYFDTALSFSN